MSSVIICNPDSRRFTLVALAARHHLKRHLTHSERYLFLHAREVTIGVDDPEAALRFGAEVEDICKEWGSTVEVSDAD